MIDLTDKQTLKVARKELKRTPEMNDPLHKLSLLTLDVHLELLVCEDDFRDYFGNLQGMTDSLKVSFLKQLFPLITNNEKWGGK